MQPETSSTPLCGVRYRDVRPVVAPRVYTRGSQRKAPRQAGCKARLHGCNSNEPCHKRMLQPRGSACPTKRGMTLERARRARKMWSHSNGDSKLAQCGSAGGNHHPNVSVPNPALRGGWRLRSHVSEPPRFALRIIHPTTRIRRFPKIFETHVCRTSRSGAAPYSPMSFSRCRACSFPWSAALRSHLAASCRSAGTPSPLA